MNIKVDASGLNRFRIALGNAQADEAIKASLMEAVMLALRRTKQKTHVITGTLRREWKVTSITKEGSNWVVWLYNDTKYAMYVEYGHRTRLNRKTGRRGWVNGQYMMTLSCEEVQRDLSSIVKKHMDSFYRRVGFKI